VNEVYCAADPFEGAKQAVAECWRNLCTVGAKPLALTDNLNFGNPEKPEIMGQFVAAVDGMRAACLALEFPIVSGNVSLYNESPTGSIPPTPAVGGVGVIEDVAHTTTIAFKRAGDRILLIGPTKGLMGRSAYLREICHREEGAPPPVDLDIERKNGLFVRGLVSHGVVTAAHDLSEGGLAVALAEMALASGIGAQLHFRSHDLPMHGFLFGEDQSRYLLTASPEKADQISASALQKGICCLIIGTTGGDALTIPGETAIYISNLRERHEQWLPHFMRGGHG
jgi:phosphoribosylformylglycinamidine synthase